MAFFHKHLKQCNTSTYLTRVAMVLATQNGESKQEMLEIGYLIHSVVRDRGRHEIQQFTASKAFIYFNLAND